MLNELPRLNGLKRKKRLGRGEASGVGKTSGRGNKGQKARKSGNVRRGFEGGQMPLHRRTPKRGFTNNFANPFAIVNLSQIETLKSLNTDITPSVLQEKKMLRKTAHAKVKLLGSGELTFPAKISVHACSQSALKKVQSAGGHVTLIAQSE